MRMLSIGRWISLAGEGALKATWLALTIVASVTAAQAADGGGTARFWNLTGETITHLTLAPTGTRDWGPDQCRNDRDGTVDFDERLRITGIRTGRYDVSFTDLTGRSCIVTGVEVREGGIFSIERDALRHCTVR